MKLFKNLDSYDVSYDVFDPRSSLLYHVVLIEHPRSDAKNFAQHVRMLGSKQQLK